MLQEWIDQWASIAGGMFGPAGMEMHQSRTTPRVESNEWEITEELTMAKLGGPFEDFISAASESWQQGVQEYRAGDEEKPFVGDPLALAQAKCATLYAYIKQCEAEGIVDGVTVDQLNCLAFDAYKILVRAKVAKDAKDAADAKRIQRDEAAKKAGLVIENP